MLNPPLSLLSNELLSCIVEHVADIPCPKAELHNLSITDRAFTQFCQSHIFRTLHLTYHNGSRSKGKAIKDLGKMKERLDRNPSFANRVREVHLTVLFCRNAWLFDDPTFLSILQLLAKSPVPPRKIHLDGIIKSCRFMIEDPILVVERLMQSFFSQTLTTLHLTFCENVPLSLFLICPRLKELLLDWVGSAKEDYSAYPDNQCFGREVPKLYFFNCCKSQSLLRQIVIPPPKFRIPVVIWSNLRTLTLCPHEKHVMACLQPILNEACDSLEELYLTNRTFGEPEQFPLASLVNLRGLSRLRAFALYALTECVVGEPWVLQDINSVLQTIPTSNQITNLSFEFYIYKRHDTRPPPNGCFDQDWVGLCDETIRISAWKPLKLELHTNMPLDIHGENHVGQTELLTFIREKLSDYPKICPHLWNPTYRDRRLHPFPRGQVRSRCRR